jgi:arylsulfatase A-like enzyme
VAAASETPPAGAPNVVIVLLDDVGYAQFGAYGSDIATPTFDRLASQGRRYANFHTTALCSPTRACLLTGRNHHSNGMARVVELAAGFPGYNATIPKENGFLSEILRAQGYATFAVGKWHLTPATEMSAGSPRDKWPLGRGFDRYYGFMGGETDQYHPELVYDNHPTEPPRTPEEGYHLTEDLADHAIRYLADLRGASPSTPVPPVVRSRAPATPRTRLRKEYIDRYRGPSTRDGTAGEKRCSPASLASGLLPRAPSSPSAPRGFRPGTR